MSEAGASFEMPQLVQERMLWHNSFWDGPLDGVCEIGGVPHWFKCANGDEFGWPVYLVFEMLPGEWDAESAHHEGFATTVGRHTEYTYDEQGRRHRREKFMAPEGWHSWYETGYAYHWPRFWEDGRPIAAWFSRTPHLRRRRSVRFQERRGTLWLSSAVSA